MAGPKIPSDYSQFRHAGLTSMGNPVIGVLCIDVTTKLAERYGSQIKSYIAASYVKFLEGAGARVVPIWIGKEKPYYQKMMNRINGILIPGGAVYFDSEMAKRTLMSNACVRSSRFIYEIAVAKNEMGEYFPLWGTCLGMQLLLLHSAGGIDARETCNRMDNALHLRLETDFRNSKMFQNMTQDNERVLREEPFCYHYHRYCLTKQSLVNSGVDEQWKVLATTKDDDGLEILTLLEHRSWPFFGCQFHPERVCYELLASDIDPCSHTLGSIDAAQYFARFFVQQCLRSRNKFDTYSQELQHSISNFSPVFTGRADVSMHWLQCYLFEDTTDYV